MNDEQLLRYSRHILLEEWGIEAQEKVGQAHALIVGAGGLGCPAAMYLAAAGLARLTLVDPDRVDATNLQRQIGHRSESIGELKVDSLRLTIARLNPEVQVQACATYADQSWLEEQVPGASVVLDCSDNFATRQAINRACVENRVPLVSGAALRFDAQVAVFDQRHDDAPCYACLFAPEANFEETACATMGVFAPLVGIIGSMQAAEALKLITGVGHTLASRLVMLDALRMEWQEIQLSRNPDCPVCGRAHV